MDGCVHMHTNNTCMHALKLRAYLRFACGAWRREHLFQQYPPAVLKCLQGVFDCRHQPGFGATAVGTILCGISLLVHLRVRVRVPCACGYMCPRYACSMCGCARALACAHCAWLRGRAHLGKVFLCMGAYLRRSARLDLLGNLQARGPPVGARPRAMTPFVRLA